jgi:hypothetical protein
MKTCTKCKEEKPLTEFYKSRNLKDGYRYQCKVCVEEYVRRYKIKNADKVKKWQAEYYKANKDKIVDSVNKYMKEKDQGLYYKYHSVRSSCVHPSHAGYPRYGGRGIKLAWDNYQDFRADMYDEYVALFEKHGKKPRFRRHDTSKDFSKENCFWYINIPKPKKKRIKKEKIIRPQVKMRNGKPIINKHNAHLFPDFVDL